MTKKSQTRLVIEEGDFNNPNKHHYCELKVQTRPFLYQANNTPLKTVPIPQTATIDSHPERLESREQSCKAYHTPSLTKSVLDVYSHDFQGTFVLKMGEPGVSPPVLIQKVEPTYSQEACIAKSSGTVLLSLIVDEEGMPRNVKVLRSLGFGLDEKAIEAVHQWRFRPGTIVFKTSPKRYELDKSVPVPIAATIEVNFRLL